MSKKSILAKALFILEMIDNIEKIVLRHSVITKALEDFEGKMAILMAIAQIGKTLKKLDDKIIKHYDLELDKEGAYYTRNYIVHDYEGVDIAFVENIVREYLPKLEKKIKKISFDFKDT